jgi:uncharacterized protein YggE
MSATRSAILRASALGAVAILGIVVLSPVFTGAPRVAAQVLTTSPSGSSPGPQGITVAGSGIITVTPDEATLSVGVQTQAATASRAQQDASAAMNKVVAAVKAAGVADADLATQWISLQPQYDNGPTGNAPSKLSGYEASQSLQVTVRQLDQTGAIIDAAVGAGANQVGSVSFSLADPSAANAKARAAAMTDAQQRARTLAQAASVTLGAPISISEVSAPSPIPFAAAPPVAGSQISTPVQAGTTQIEVDVQVTFAIGS